MDKPLLHIELLPNEQMNFKIKGDPIIVCSMIAEAMDAQLEIAAAMIGAVMFYADNNGIPRNELGNMVHFHK